MRWQRWILWVVLALPFGVPVVGFAQVDDAPSLAGVIDIHAHVAPETSMMNFKRAFDAIEAAQIARIYGMRGMVLKEHYTETASWAYLVSQIVPGVEVFGAVRPARAPDTLEPNGAAIPQSARRLRCRHADDTRRLAAPMPRAGP